MLNPEARRSLANVGGAWPCVVLDDALRAPQDWVALASLHQAAFTPAATSAFPGLELPLPESVANGLGRALVAETAPHLGLGELLDAHGRLSMVTLQPTALRPLQRLCHRDRLFLAPGERAVAAVLYLFQSPELGGTNFFQPRQDAAATQRLMSEFANLSSAEADARLGVPPAYLTTSNRHFELMHVVPARWNRLIAYDGFQFHGSHIEHPERLSADPARGRLTLNLFMRVRDESAHMPPP